jgi:cytochrome c oxidase cbb3-type subunit I
MELLFKTQLGRLRIISYLEGISLLVLLCIAMPLKYWRGDASLVKAIGPIHGMLFLLFVFNTLSVAVEQRWKFSETTWKVLIACVIPFGTFYVDRHILKRMTGKAARPKRTMLSAILLLTGVRNVQAQAKGKAFFSLHSSAGLLTICFAVAIVVLLLAIYLKVHLAKLTKKAMLLMLLLSCSMVAIAQDEKPTPLMNQTGIIITLILILIPILAAVVILIFKLKRLARQHRSASSVQVEKELAEADHKGLLSEVSNENNINFIRQKRNAPIRPPVDPALAKLILWFLGSATFWLLFGTTIGEYLGIKFVSPDVDHVSWLSFGRLRPVHTNAVFWGWSSLAMLGLGHYIVPRVSNAPLASLKRGWYTLILVNAAVLFGTIALMSGINNGGGEYREYIWPIMALFAIGLFLTLSNFLQTIARRATKEIYISNWYIVSAVIFTIVIVLVAYLPFWQDGLGETIVQGYYMHQGVGMWFMLFLLGITYYVLPQQLNRPIYSYGLGIMAFWAQILFYTVIGTHHFVFSSVPWWLQTVAIVGSVGMIIPVVAGTTNFFMTFKNGWHKIGSSYTLPFFVVGLIFYFTGSMQGTAEAFRYTNLVWHFTDFTVAHSHITMYGIIAFLLWASIYAIVPRLTGREPWQITIGAHFWLALIGLLFYTVPLMYGATYRGIMWQSGKPFIDSVVFMAPFWLWRAIGGSLMWLSHLFFAYNMYKMLTPQTQRYGNLR